MRKIFIYIAFSAVASAAASCTKDAVRESDLPQYEGTQFTASIETGTNTRTMVERYETGSGSGVYKNKVIWEDTDLISINGTEFQPKVGYINNNYATFEKVVSSDATPSSPFRAYYPASLFDGATATLPASYTYTDGTAYEDGSFDTPMFAYSTTNELTFKALCGVLAITIRGNDIVSVSSIEVTSSDKRMNGAFTANNSGVLSFTSPAPSTDADRKVTLTFTSPKTVSSSGSTFYIPVPAATHGSLTIAVTDGSNEVQTKTTTKADGVAVASNMIYPILFSNNSGPEIEYVEMGGLKWAKMNLGATTVAGSYATCAGDYYAWGETETSYTNISWSGTTGTFPGWKTEREDGFAWSSYCGNDSFAEWDPVPYDATTKVLKPDYDVVRQKTGEGWRMPTSQEFRNLYDACGGTTSSAGGSASTTSKGVYWCDNYNGVAGVLFIAQDNGEHLFFPAAGYGAGTNLDNAGSFGLYWSSSLDADHPNAAYYLNFNSGYFNPQNSNDRYFGFPVRPVANP